MIELKRQEHIQKNLCGNSKDFISCRPHAEMFDINHVNLYRKMQPYPLRKDIQLAKMHDHIQNINPYNYQTQLKTRSIIGYMKTHNKEEPKNFPGSVEALQAMETVYEVNRVPKKKLLHGRTMKRNESFKMGSFTDLPDIASTETFCMTTQ